MTTLELIDGPVGIEGTHTILAPSDGAPALVDVVLNDITANGGLWWHQVKQIDGLFDAADGDANTAMRTGRIGELAYPELRRGRNIVYTGVTLGTTLQHTRRGGTQLRALANTMDNTSLLIAPNAALGSLAFKLNGRCVSDGLTQPDIQNVGPTALPTPWQRPFVFTFRALDPRAYAQGLSDTLSVAAVGSGSGIFFPQTFTCNSLTPVEPTFVINGPFTAGTPLVLSVTRSEGSFQLVFDMPTAADTAVLTVDFDARTATYADGTDCTSYIDWGASSWWDTNVYPIRPGANGITVQTAGAWTVTTLQATY